jgi:3-hydroxyisobutyrate dehydrogenase-like beta-hydroxyacid dehydrogenase
MVALGTQAASRGIFVLDAPVSGGGGAAAARKLTVMVGGDVDTFEAARPILETFAGLLVHVGDLGAAQMAKLINNALMAAHVSIAHHALGVGSTLGLNRQALSEIVKVSSGRSFGFEVYSRLPTPGAFEHGARLLAKDVRLLGEALESTEDASFATLRDLVTPFLNLVHEDAGQRTR